MIKYMAVAVAVAVSGGVAVPVAVPVVVPVAGLTKRFFNQQDFLINVWGYIVQRIKTTQTNDIKQMDITLTPNID